MKNYGTILLALVLFAQALSPLTGQLAKVPALMGHFYFHHDHAQNELDAELTFVDFLAQHYGDPNHHGHTDQEHSNLPFRCVDASFTALLLTLPIDPLLPIVGAVPAIQAKASFGCTTFHSNLFVRDIFRPPLSC